MLTFILVLSVFTLIVSYLIDIVACCYIEEDRKTLKSVDEVIKCTDTLNWLRFGGIIIAIALLIDVMYLIWYLTKI